MVAFLTIPNLSIVSLENILSSCCSLCVLWLWWSWWCSFPPSLFLLSPVTFPSNPLIVLLVLLLVVQPHWQTHCCFLCDVTYRWRENLSFPFIFPYFPYRSFMILYRTFISVSFLNINFLLISREDVSMKRYVDTMKEICSYPGWNCCTFI